MFRSKKGFTLVEILIIMAMILLLAGLSMSYMRYIQSARDSERTTALKNIAVAVLEYQIKYNKYPLDEYGCVPDSLAPDFIQKIPRSPSGAKYNEGCGPNGRYGYGYASQNFAIMAQMETPFAGNFGGNPTGLTGSLTESGIALLGTTARGAGNILLVSQLDGAGTSTTSVMTGSILSSSGNFPVLPPPPPPAIDCMPASRTINNHQYDIPLTFHGFSYIGTVDVVSVGGTITFAQKFICSNGVLNMDGGEYILNENCFPGYISNKLSCVGAVLLRFDPNFGGSSLTTRIVPINSVVDVFPNEPSRAGYTFDGWYSQPEGGDITTKKTIIPGDTTLYAHWAEIALQCNHNPTSLISCYNNPDIILSNGQVWQSCNTGAQYVCQGGNFYQWGRNIGFPTYSSPDLEIGPVVSSSIFPTSFITNNTWPKDWLSPSNHNLWGGALTTTISGTYQTNSPLDKGIMRGPCDEGYHIPTAKEWCNAVMAVTGGSTCTMNEGIALQDILSLPRSGMHSYMTGEIDDNGVIGYYWSSTPNAWDAYAFMTVNATINPNQRASGMTLRCLKDTTGVTITFMPNGGSGTNTVRRILSSSSIGNLPTEPTRAGYVFDGWYTASTGGTQLTVAPAFVIIDATSSGSLLTTDTPIMADLNLYAHWTPVGNNLCDAGLASMNISCSSIPDIRIGSQYWKACNVGATSVCTNGGYYQWGKSSSSMDSAYDWLNISKNNLWGGENTIQYGSHRLLPSGKDMPTDYQLAYSPDSALMQGPCDPGYHIPSSNDWDMAREFGNHQALELLYLPSDSGIYNPLTATTDTPGYHPYWIGNPYNYYIGDNPRISTNFLNKRYVDIEYLGSGFERHSFTDPLLPIGLPIRCVKDRTPASITVNFYGSGNALLSTKSISPLTYLSTLGELPPPPTQSGFIFGGWYTLPQSTTSFSTTYRGNAYTIPVNATAFSENSYLIWKPPLIWYMGVSWSSEKKEGIQWDTQSTGHLNLYPRWIPIVDANSITFDTNGGSFYYWGNRFSRYIQQGTSIGYFPDSPTRPGYAFSGWYTTATGGELINTNTIAGVDSVYYAHWMDLKMFCVNNPTTAIPCSMAPDITLINGQVWKSCNAGAQYVCQGGNMYQWGRNIGFSSLGEISSIAGPLSPSIASTTTDFITSGGDWISPSDDNLWGGVNLSMSSGTFQMNTIQDQILMRGPCELGYHVPSAAEWCDAISTLAGTNGCDHVSGNTVQNTLFLSLPGLRMFFDGSIANQGVYGGYWTNIPDVPFARGAYFYNNSIDPSSYSYRAFALPVRCLRNALAPRTITLTFDVNGGSSNTTSKTLNTDGSTPIGSFPADPYRSGYVFDGWYTTVTGGTKISTSTQVSYSTRYYAHWIDFGFRCVNNPSTAISCDTAPDITLANGQIWKACDIGAQYVCQGGKYFQWGRGVPFSATGNITVTTGPLSLIASQNTLDFIGAAGDWLTPPDDNLWGGLGMDISHGIYQETTVSDQSLMQGPCESGYHVPTAKEWCDAVGEITGTNGCVHVSNNYAQNTLFIPITTIRMYLDASLNGAPLGWYWTSTPESAYARGAYFYNGSVDPTSYSYRTFGLSLRCLKNTLAPRTITITFSANGGDPSSTRSIVTDGNTPIGTLPSVGRPGFILNGWFTEPTGGTQIYSSTKPLVNTTYYAQWTDIGLSLKCLNNPVTMIPCTSAPDILIGNKYWKACNVGAEYLCQPGDVYQWGRNTIGFTPSTSWPYDWQFPQVPNAWGGADTTSTTGTYKTVTPSNQSLMQGPCESGYHIPTAKEWCDAVGLITGTNNCAVVSNSTTVHDFMQIPLFGYRSPNGTNYSSVGSLFWSSTPDNSNSLNALFQASSITPAYSIYRANGFSIRCVKNVFGPYPVTATFATNDGTNSIASTKSVTIIDELPSKIGTLPTAPTRNGYTLSGWYTTPVGGEQITSDTMILENTTYYAQWKNNWIFYFDANGASGDPALYTLPGINPISIGTRAWWESAPTVPSNSLYIHSIAPGSAIFGNIPTPTRAGYIFDGWYPGVLTTEHLCKINTGAYTWTYRSCEQIAYEVYIAGTYISSIGYTCPILYPQISPCQIQTYWNWTINNVDLNPQWLDSPVIDFDTVHLITPNTPITLSGSTATGTTYYARWLRSATVIFDANGGGGQSPTSKVITTDGVVSLGTLPTSPIRSGYAFEGWYTRATGGDLITTETQVSGDVTYYAQWTSVALDANGGKHAPSNQTILQYPVHKDTAITSFPAIPVRAGFTFLGWFTDPTNGTQVTESIVITGSTTYYAHWQDLHLICNNSPSTAVSCDTAPDITFPNGQSWKACNVGATYVCQGGNYYQWGRNISFPSDVSIPFSVVQGPVSIDIANNNLGFIISGNQGIVDWLDTQASNLWGGVNTTQTTGTYQTISPSDQSLMQGPCPIGYHVPTYLEWYKVIALIDASGITSVPDVLFLPKAGYRSRTDGRITWQGYYDSYWRTIVGYGQYWTSTVKSNSGGWGVQNIVGSVGFWGNGIDTSGGQNNDSLHMTQEQMNGYSVRCMSNTLGTHDIVVTFDGNGGSGQSPTSKTLSTIDSVTLGTLSSPPTRNDGYLFAGWYTSQYGGVKATPDMIVRENTTIYAQWSPPRCLTNPTTAILCSDTSDIALANGQVWKACNIGANYVCQIGDFYQWGRNRGFGYSDLVSISTTTLAGPVSIATANLSQDFISGYNADWLTPSDDALWGGEGTDWSSGTYQTVPLLSKIAMQGPCESGYHVPTQKEWCNAFSATSGSDICSLGEYGDGGSWNQYSPSGFLHNSGLWIPMAGSRDYAGRYLTAYQSNYWTSTPVTNSSLARFFFVNSGYLVPRTTQYRSNGNSIRCLRNTLGDMVATIIYNPNGGTTASGSVIYNIPSGTSKTLGTLPIPTRAGYVFLGWYTAASGGTLIDANTPVTGNTTYYAQWQDTGAICRVNPPGQLCSEAPDIVLSNGQSWKACNPGATYVCQGGNWYEWGRNIGFPSTQSSFGTNYGSYTLSYANSNTNFIVPYGPTYDWLDTGDLNRWGGYTAAVIDGTYQDGSSTDKVLMQGPCESGYHVPTKREWCDTVIAITGQDYCNVTKSTTYSNVTIVQDTLHVPLPGYIWSASRYDTNNSLHYWTSTPYLGNIYYGSIGSQSNLQSYTFVFGRDGSFTPHQSHFRELGFGVRCLKNTIVSRSVTITFDANGGGGHAPTSKIFTTDGTTPLGTLPSDPTRAGYTFLGWYTLQNGGNQVDTNKTPIASTTYYAHWMENETTENALHFDGSDDYLSIPDTTGLPTGNNFSYTLEAFIRPDRHTTSESIVGWGNYGNYYQTNVLRLETGGKVRNYWWGNDLVVDSGDLTDGKWHHIAATYDGATRKIYVDGVLKGQDNPAWGPVNISSITNLTVGLAYPGEYFKGAIDDVRVWSVARTQSEIQSSMFVPLIGNESGLAVYYRFNVRTPNTNNIGLTKIDDIAGINNNGILNNFTLNGTTSNIVQGKYATITFDANGGSGHSPTSKSITTDGTTPLGTLPSDSTRAGYAFLGWYTATSGGTQVTTSTPVTGNATYYAQWQDLNLYCITNPSSLISCSSAPDITLANGQIWKACNVGAQNVCQGGNFYQWGRNRGIPSTGTISTVSGPLSLSDANNTTYFITSYSDWLTPGDNNLWGGGNIPSTGLFFDATVSDQSLMQGPCDSGYHVPTRQEWCNAFQSIASVDCASIGTYNAVSGASPQNTLFVPLVGNRDKADGVLYNQALWGFMWTSSTYTTYSYLIGIRSDQFYPIWYDNRAHALPVRCLKNTFVPHAITITFDANGGSGQSPTSESITTDGTTPLGTLPSDPTRAGYTFLGWYIFQNGGTKIDATKTPTTSTTYYAHWQESETTENALNFDGSNDYVSTANTANIPVGNSSYTLEAMIKPSRHNLDGIVGWGNYGYQNQSNGIRLGSNGTIVNWWWANDLTITSGNLADGQWHHVAATYDGTTRKIYVDGVLKGQDNPGALSVPNANNFSVGLVYTPDFAFLGSMDNVRIWNTARTQSEIQSNMYVSLDVDQPGLIVNYRFNQRTPYIDNTSLTTIPDIAGGDNNGILNNFTMNGTTSNIVPGPSLYTVSFDANGGINVPSSRQALSGSPFGSLPIPPTNPSGLHFAGWYTDPILGTKLTTTTIISSSVTYYAHWTDSIYGACTVAGQTIVASTIYPGCDTPDKVICTDVGAGYTMAMCNVGSSVVGTSSASYGYYYQWGRNVGMPYGGLTSSISGPIDSATAVNNTTSFVIASGDWLNPSDDNLWGGASASVFSTASSTDQSLMQGPCAVGYHVPTQAEWCSMINSLASTSTCSVAGNTNVQSALQFVYPGLITGTSYNWTGTYGWYWMSTPIGGDSSNIEFSPTEINFRSYVRSYGFSVRCMKN